MKTFNLLSMTKVHPKLVRRKTCPEFFVQGDCVLNGNLVQRIPEYEKYLQELLVETDVSHPDFDDLTKTTQKVSNMVKEREEEMNNAENEYKVDYVQDRFPNDDLQLNEKEKSNQRYRALQNRRRSAPSAVLIKSISTGKSKGTTNLSNRPLPFMPDDIPSRPQNSHRVYLLEGPVQLSVGIPLQDRYLFLFNDLLLIAKKKSATTFKLKARIRVCELWLTTNFLEDVADSNTSCPSDRSFVIGWPTANMVATFGTSDLKDLWWSKLKSQIAEEKSREEPKTLPLKICNKEMTGYASWKIVTVSNTEEVHDVIKSCLEQFEIADAKPEDYQILVKSGREGTSSVYQLYGHEHLYSIKMSHVRDAGKTTGNSMILPVDTDLGSETLSSEYQCQFIIIHKSKSLLFSGVNKKAKKSPISNIFRRSASRRDVREDFDDSTDSSLPGKLFGQRLADICEDETLPKPIMDLMTRLFHEGPTVTGILRKSANKKSCDTLKAVIDSDEDYQIDDWSILVVGDTLKMFFREMPDCVFGGSLYEKLIASSDISEHSERVREVKRLIESLPKCNQNILRHFFSVLYHIDKNSQENNMTAYNLAVCVGPSMLRNPQISESRDPVSDACKKETAFVQFVIEAYPDLFGGDNAKLFGEPKTMRQDSGTDSDSLHSILSMQESSGGLRRDDSSLDSLDRELYNSELDASPQLAKSHLSPTNLSRDSGLTLSDSQLYDEGAENENLLFLDRRSGMFSHEDQTLPVPPPRSKRRRGSEPQTTLDQARVIARMCAVPGNGALASGMGQEKPRATLSHSMPGDAFRTVKYHAQLQTKKLSMESLGSVEENLETDFRYDVERIQPQHESGILRKSSSGARIFFDEELVLTQRSDDMATSFPPGLSLNCEKRRSSNDTSSQDSDPSTPGSPYFYRRVWLSDVADNSKPVNLSASYGGSHTVHSNVTKDISTGRGLEQGQRRSRLCKPEGQGTKFSHSAPPTPDVSSPSNSPRSSFNKYLSQRTETSEQLDSAVDASDGQNTVETPPSRPAKPPSLSLSNNSPLKSGFKYLSTDFKNCGSPPPEVILRNQLSKSSSDRQIFNYSPSAVSGEQVVRHGHEKGGSCSSEDDEKAMNLSIGSSVSSLNSCGSQEKLEKQSSKESKTVSVNSPVEKSSSDTNVLRQFNKGPTHCWRPDRPPSYQEAIHRKIMLKSGVPVTLSDKDIIEQSVNSAHARKLYEESLKKYYQEQQSTHKPRTHDALPKQSQESKLGGEKSIDAGPNVSARAVFSKHHIGSVIQEEPSTPPKSPSSVKRSQSDSDKMKEIKQYKNSMFYLPATRDKPEPTSKSDLPIKVEVNAARRDRRSRYSDITPLKVDKDAATLQYYQKLMKSNSSDQVPICRQPPPYRHPPPISHGQTRQANSSSKDTSSPSKSIGKSRINRQDSGSKPAVDFDEVICTEESLV